MILATGYLDAILARVNVNTLLDRVDISALLNRADTLASSPAEPISEQPASRYHPPRVKHYAPAPAMVDLRCDP